jgi:hypothetical protein
LSLEYDTTPERATRIFEIFEKIEAEKTQETPTASKKKKGKESDTE